MLYARGGHNVGHSFFVKDGALQFDYNALGTHHRATRAVRRSPPAGTSSRPASTAPVSGGTLTLAVDGEDLTGVEIPKIVRMLGSTGLDVGRDALSPVVDDYERPVPVHRHHRPDHLRDPQPAPMPPSRGDRPRRAGQGIDERGTVRSGRRNHRPERTAQLFPISRVPAH